jgi:hypothetical protein
MSPCIAAGAKIFVRIDFDFIGRVEIFVMMVLLIKPQIWQNGFE